MKKKISLRKKSAKIVSLTAMVAAMCTNAGMNEADTRAAQAAMSDIADECGRDTARAVIIQFSPFDNLIA